MRRGLATLAAAAAVLPLIPFAPSAATVGAAHPSAGPIVGECYDLTDEQARDDYWADAVPVPCTESHTFEVTETSLVPMDVNAIDFARDRCGMLDVWTAVGVNSSSAGVIEDPIRIEARSFYAPPDHYVCGAVAVRYRGSAPATLVRLSSSIDRLGAGARRALRHCSSAKADRSALAPPITVRCASRPRWQATAWILWSALYDAYPGRVALKRRAAELCGPGTVRSLPTVASWNDGVARTWCYRKVQ